MPIDSNNPKFFFRRLLPMATAAALLIPIAIEAVESDSGAKDKVFLEHADRLIKAPYTTDEDGDYQVLIGNVTMRKGGMVMTCDSAHFYDKINSFEAFGNVKMEQGDTLFVYGDRLFYDGPEELATLSADLGKKVKMINRDVTLTTYMFYYDMVEEVGFYDNWGELTDPENRLESIEGEYHTRDKNAWFYHRVQLDGQAENGSQTQLTTDSLNYNTLTHIARIMAPAVITNTDGVIYTSSGTYNTTTGNADLYNRSLVITNRGNTLTGDTLSYDRETGIGHAYGNMILTDSARSTSLYGDFGYYNDPLDSAFVTGKALAKEYSKGDTLYLHGDTINAYVEITGADSTRVMNVFHRVRFYRSDLQGIADSISVTESDSLMRMYRQPVVWSDNRQIAGKVIFVHINDSMPDWARLPEGGIMSEHIAEDCYNQLSGSEITTWFNDSTVDRLYIQGNVQMVLFPMENDSTYNKYIYLESSFMDASFEGRSPKKINFWPETTYDVVPLYLAKRTAYTLQKFHDYNDLRPKSPDDIFIIPSEMIDLIESQPINPKTLRVRKEEEKPLTDATESIPETTLSEELTDDNQIDDQQPDQIK